MGKHTYSVGHPSPSSAVIPTDLSATPLILPHTQYETAIKDRYRPTVQSHCRKLWCLSHTCTLTLRSLPGFITSQHWSTVNVIPGDLDRLTVFTNVTQISIEMTYLYELSFWRYLSGRRLFDGSHDDELRHPFTELLRRFLLPSPLNSVSLEVDVESPSPEKAFSIAYTKLNSVFSPHLWSAHIRAFVTSCVKERIKCPLLSHIPYYALVELLPDRSFIRDLTYRNHHPDLDMNINMRRLACHNIMTIAICYPEGDDLRCKACLRDEPDPDLHGPVSGGLPKTVVSLMIWLKHQRGSSRRLTRIGFPLDTCPHQRQWIQRTIRHRWIDDSVKEMLPVLMEMIVLEPNALKRL